MKAERTRYILRFIFLFFTPNFWRRILFHYVRIQVTLDNGRSVKFNASEVNFQLNTSNRKYTINDMREFVIFDVSKIVSVREVRWW